jgi:hypothetical protein
MPSINLFSGLPEFRPEDIIIFFGISLLPLKLDRYKYFILVLVGIIVFSISINSLIGDRVFLNEFFVIWLFVKISFLIQLLYNQSVPLETSFFYKLVLISIIVSLIQLFNIYDYNFKIAPEYSLTQSESLQNDIIFLRRVFGTFENPNMYAQFLALSVIPLIHFRKSGWLVWLVLLTIFLTQSRQGILLCLFNIFVLTLWGEKKIPITRIARPILIGISLTLLAIYFKNDLIYIQDFNDVLFGKFSDLGDIQNDSSAESRLSVKWPFYLNVLFSSLTVLLIGIGRLKDTTVYTLGTPDSEIIHVSLAFGLITPIFIFLLVYFLIKNVKAFIPSVVLLFNFIVNFSWSGFFFDFQLFPAFIFLIFLMRNERQLMSNIYKL